MCESVVVVVYECMERHEEAAHLPHDVHRPHREAVDLGTAAELVDQLLGRQPVDAVLHAVEHALERALSYTRRP